jgi:hypothetical protein
MRLAGRSHDHRLAFEFFDSTDMLRHDEMQSAAFARRTEDRDFLSLGCFFLEILEVFNNDVARSVEERGFKGFFVLYLHNPDVEIAVLLCHLADGKDHRRSVNVSVG